jgi:succinoglycan biosynthesis protein ExoA
MLKGETVGSVGEVAAERVAVLPFISVVVPVRNEGRFIGDVIDRLMGQDYPEERFEVIVVDGRSSDGTAGVVREKALGRRNLILLENSKSLSSSSRNIGIRGGRGEIFLIVDGHCLIESNHLLRDVAGCFLESGCICLGRSQPLDPPGITPFQMGISVVRRSLFGHSSRSYVYSDHRGLVDPTSVATAYRKEIFQEIGLFDESFDACEDLDFNFRIASAGHKCYIDPRLTIRYFPRETLGGLYRQMVRYGSGRFRFAKKHKKAFDLDCIGLASFSAVVLVMAFLSLLDARIPLAFIGMYAFAACAYSLFLSIKNRYGKVHYLPAIIATFHLGLVIGFCMQAVKTLTAGCKGRIRRAPAN